MPDWLQRLLHGGPSSRGGAKPPQSGVAALVTVAVTPDDIVVSRTEGKRDRLLWSDLGAVGIVTTDAGPFASDLFWLLQSRDRRHSVTVPLGADGEHDLLLTMQARLKGFDNMAVVEAMSTTGNAGFTVWDSSWPND